MRVIHLLPKAHPDYYIAVSEFKLIFAKLKYQQSYPKVSNFTNALCQWEYKFSSYYFEEMTEKEKVVFLGK